MNTIKTIIVGLTATFLQNVHCQPLDGVYVGEFITLNTVIVIRSIGTTSIGQIYKYEFDKLLFTGSCDDDSSLDAWINVDKTTTLNFQANLVGDSLHVRLMNGNLPINKGTLLRISSNPDHNLKKVFKQMIWERDQRFIGKWTTIKNLDASGMIRRNDNFAAEYRNDGRYLFDEALVRKRLNELHKNSGRRNNSSYMKNNLTPKMTWETKGNTILIHSEAGGPSMIRTFEFRNDTLILTNSNGAKEITVRQR
jgi:hypothetical protein